MSPLPTFSSPPPPAHDQIEEARRREQADKIAAIHALEAQSQEIMRHKQAMAALQTRIQSMQSQLLVGGQNVEDTPQFRCVCTCLFERLPEGDVRVARSLGRMLERAFVLCSAPHHLIPSAASPLLSYRPPQDAAGRGAGAHPAAVRGAAAGPRERAAERAGR